MTVTVAEIFARAARRIGGRTGTVGTVAVGGSTTTAILNGLVNTTGDDTAYAAARLFFLEGATSPRQTLISTWNDVLGRATFNNLTSPPVAADDYILSPREDYTLNEYDAAWSEALRESRRTYRQVIPLTPNLDLYPLTQCDWLRGDGDIDAVWLNQSPIWLHNEDFALWQNGASAAPDGWTLSGSGATVTRVSGGIRSPYAARVTAGGAAATLTQTIPYSLTQWITRRIAPVYTPMRGAAWASASAASAGRVGTNDGAATTYGSYHTGNGVPQYLTMSLTPTEDMTTFTLTLYVAAGQTVDFHAAVLMQNTTDAPDAFSIRDQGSQAYVEYPYQKAVRNVGGVPTVELSYPTFTTMNQLIVYTRRPFPQLTAYSDLIEDQYARALEFGLLAWLLVNNKPQQDRARLDRVLGEAQGEWARFLSNVIDLPVPRPPQRAEIWGA